MTFIPVEDHTDFNEYVVLARAGHQIVFTRDGVPVAELHLTDDASKANRKPRRRPEPAKD